MKKYILKNLIAWDMTICALWPWSKERETISGLLGSDFDGSIFELAVNKVFYKMGWWPDPNHCDDCAATEKTFIK